MINKNLKSEIEQLKAIIRALKLEGDADSRAIEWLKRQLNDLESET